MADGCGIVGLWRAWRRRWWEKGEELIYLSQRAQRVTKKIPAIYWKARQITPRSDFEKLKTLDKYTFYGILISGE